MRKPSIYIASVLTLLAVAGCGKQVNTSDKAQIEAVVKNYIMAHPEVVIQSLRSYQQKNGGGQAGQPDDSQVNALIQQNKEAVYNDKTSPVAGNPNGKEVVVEFFDYNCGYCKKMLPDIKKIIAEDKEAKFVFKEIPILGPTSETAALAALVVHDISPAKYFDFQYELMSQNLHDEKTVKDIIKATANKVGINGDKVLSKMDDQKYKDQLTKNVQLATTLTIHGTPTFIANGRMIRGAVGYDGLKAAMKSAPAPQGGKPSPAMAGRGAPAKQPAPEKPEPDEAD